MVYCVFVKVYERLWIFVSIVSKKEKNNYSTVNYP